jgi:hypothetical protein
MSIYLAPESYGTVIWITLIFGIITHIIVPHGRGLQHSWHTLEWDWFSTIRWLVTGNLATFVYMAGAIIGLVSVPLTEEPDLYNLLVTTIFPLAVVGILGHGAMTVVRLLGAEIASFYTLTICNVGIMVWNFLTIRWMMMVHERLEAGAYANYKSQIQWMLGLFGFGAGLFFLTLTWRFLCFVYAQGDSKLCEKIYFRRQEIAQTPLLSGSNYGSMTN